MTFNKINLEFVLKISGCDKVESYLKQTNELIKITKKEVNAMKKINAKHDNKDRVICVTVTGKHRFYYQPAGTRERIWLFDTKAFYGSVFGFFRKNGRNLEGTGFSMTIKELYEKGRKYEGKIGKQMERIPVQIDYVLRENALDEKVYERVVHPEKELDYDYAAGEERVA